jgi:hypothetical protein
VTQICDPLALVWVVLKAENIGGGTLVARSLSGIVNALVILWSVLFSELAWINVRIVHPPSR